MIAWGLHISIACVRAVAGDAELLSFDAGVQAKLGPFTEGVDLPNERASPKGRQEGQVWQTGIFQGQGCCPVC